VGGGGGGVGSLSSEKMSIGCGWHVEFRVENVNKRKKKKKTQCFGRSRESSTQVVFRPPSFKSQKSFQGGNSHEKTGRQQGKKGAFFCVETGWWNFTSKQITGDLTSVIPKTSS